MGEPHGSDMDVPPHRLFSTCHECNGQGERQVAWAVRLDSRAGTMVMPLDCPACDASGIIDGFVPPL
jgi:hypothetical protein